MISWIERTGMVGGYPVKVTTYWEGLYKSKTMFWITPLSNGEWHLVSAGNNNTQIKSIKPIQNRCIKKLL